MTTLVLLLVLAAALSHAVWNAMIKGRGGDPLAASTGLSITWALLGAPLLFVVGPLDRAAWPHLAASITTHLVYFSLLVRAYRESDLSVVYTLARGLPPLLVAAMSIFVPGERPGAVAMIGAIAIAIGVLLLGAQGGAASRRVIGIALVIAVCIATYTMLDGLGTRASGDAATYVTWLCTLQGALFAIGALAIGRAPLAREVRTRWKVGLIGGVLSALGYAIALWAMARAPIALVAALREISVVFAALIGTFALDEPFGRRRLIAAAVVAMGVIAVRVGG
ncbi:DMT family transporter [Sandaracinus amylolyticus]|uniref:DMT family transporter n=1 Tax=Sandaracinus amylolyticus TaxID=927083 RepID=UPI001F19A263|nr:DMT family transporter [Sandaracinus amylolyticus]UJR85320.1 Hypothetical protein I5071_74000 [Sandaracinus amylolyticus]